MTTSRRASAADHLAALRALPEAGVPAYLTAHSDLPGPRSNLELIDAFARTAPAALILRLADEPDEYLRCCGVAGLGRLLVDACPSAPVGAAPGQKPWWSTPELAPIVDLLSARAGDGLWRVREAAAMAAQRLGDGRPWAMADLVACWLTSDDLLVVRAAVASICEPRLLDDPGMAAAALDACRAASERLTELPAADRRADSARVLRQALGYCWSVAIVAAPERGLGAFAALTEAADADPDLAWIVRENRSKKRLQKLRKETPV